MKYPVIIFGNSELAKSVKCTLEDNEIIVYGYILDENRKNNIEDDVPILGTVDDKQSLEIVKNNCRTFVASEDLLIRKLIVNKLVKEYKQMPINVIHRNAFVSKTVTLGHGNFINLGVVIGNEVSLGNHCLIHTSVVVEHNAKINDFVQIGAGSNIGVGVIISEDAFIGIGVTIVSGVRVEKGARIGAGSVVISDVKQNKTVFGNPATEIDEKKMK